MFAPLKMQIAVIKFSNCLAYETGLGNQFLFRLTRAHVLALQVFPTTAQTCIYHGNKPSEFKIDPAKQRIVLQQRMSGQIMSDKKQVENVPEGEARFFKTRQMKANEKGFVGFETVWEPFQKEVEYETPKRP